MQKKVVDWLYNLQSRWGILKEEERSLYEYAYRLLLSRILIYSIIIALGIITGNWLEMFSFLLPFVILRQYVGGIHLKRSVSCMDHQTLGGFPKVKEGSSRGFDGK